MRVLRLIAVCVVAFAATAASASPGRAADVEARLPSAVGYDLDVHLDPAARTISGSADVVVDNTAAVPIDELALVLYPNRFASEDPGVDDVNRPYVYPREEFSAGGITVERVETRDGSSSGEWLPVLGMGLEEVAGWRDTLLRVKLPSSVAPGRRVVVRLDFRTILPERYGPFGVPDGRVVALGGWFPIVPRLSTNGSWHPDTPAAPATVTGRLRVAGSYTVAVGAQLAAAGHGGVISFEHHGAAASLILLASDAYRVHRREVEGTSVVLLELPVRNALSLPPVRKHALVMLDAIERTVRQRPAILRGLPDHLMVAEAPLRLELTGRGTARVAVVSERALRVHKLLRYFHERELAAAVYAAVLQSDVAARETATDAPWILEGLAAELAGRYLSSTRPRHRSVYDWIGLFNLLAIVDRFESAPKIPFARAFFPESRHADQLRDGVESFARDRPAGRTILTKLRNEIGEQAFATVVERYLSGRESLREAAAAVHGEPLDWLFDQWVAPYPEINYALVDAELNGPGAALWPGTGDGSREQGETAAGRASISGGDAAGPHLHRLTVSRASSRPVREAVEVEVRGAGERRAHLRWNDAKQDAVIELRTPWRARRAVLDPDRRLLEETLVDNAEPRQWQVVLDSADVTVTSSEFGVSGLFVGRRRYDYTKDIGLIGFFSDRDIGLHVGPRLHFGTANDATNYRHNLFAFYTLAGLRDDFRDDSRPAIVTDGRRGGLGLRYDYGDEIAYDNPTSATKVRVFGDWYDGALGSSFDYAGAGLRASAVRPLLSPRTLIAVQALNAFSAPLGGSRVPNQGRYSLGGDLAIRGIPVQERLGENIVLVRSELRQTVYPEVDLNLMDALVVRRGQVRLFVDTGRVDDGTRGLYRASDFAVGVGIGAAMFYDFMGFYPGVAYVALAQRVDRFSGVENRVQFLFGTRQAF